MSGQITLFEYKKLQISLEVDNGQSDYVIICDPGLLRQAITNLLQNARESLLENNVKSPHITLLLQETDDDTILTISDNGPGFPDMDIAQLLEPYVTTRQKGTGLGLAIVSKIMDDHAGRMELGAAESGGASVKLWFKRPQSDKA